jgi:hypothetical protein
MLTVVIFGEMRGMQRRGELFRPSLRLAINKGSMI